MPIHIDSSKDLSHFNEYYLVNFSMAIFKIFQIDLLKKKNILYTKLIFSKLYTILNKNN
jgi:hypothetical protein